MNDKYKIIDIPLFEDLKDVINILLEYNKLGKLVKFEFNGVWLYSDKVTLDNAYLEITGMNYCEFKKMRIDFENEMNKRKEDHIKAIPELTKTFIEEGHKIISSDKWKMWDEIVPIRLSDLYEGMELRDSLKIINILNSNGSLRDAIKEIDSQSHSGMSYQLVREIVRQFCDDRGDKFYFCTKL